MGAPWGGLVFLLQIHNTCKKWKANVETRYLVTDGFSLTYSMGWCRKHHAGPSFLRLTSKVEPETEKKKKGEFFRMWNGVSTQICRNYHFLSVLLGVLLYCGFLLFLHTSVSWLQLVTVFSFKNSNFKIKCHSFRYYSGAGSWEGISGRNLIICNIT